MFKLQIGNHTYLKDIYNPLEVPLVIGKFCSISFGLTILGDDHACITVPEVVSTYPFDALWGGPQIQGQRVRGEIVIGNDVWIGMETCIRPGIAIGDGAIIGAGSMVTRNVLPYEIVSGNPLRFMRYRFTTDQIEKLRYIKWWDWSDEKIQRNLSLLTNIDTFLSHVYDNKIEI